MKKLLTIVLFGFVAVSVAVLAFRIAREQAHDSVADARYKSIDSRPQPASLVSIAGDNADVVCYFMNNQRCSNCVKIEEYSKEAVDGVSGDDAVNGAFVWRVINVDEPENRHFIQDFELHTKSVVLVKIRDGRQVEWKNLDQIWTLLRHKEVFQRYVSDEVAAFFAES